uniref:DNA helicase MCM9 n=2 Tax=Hirondellea gigas TaxID=1518452 RepID=A0A6A7G4Z0_9CRUS
MTSQAVAVQLPQPRRIKAKDVFVAYLLHHHTCELMAILENPSTDDHFALEINFMTLMQQHVEVAEALLSKPERLLPVLQSSVMLAQQQLLQQEEQQHQQKDLSLKSNVHPRLVGVPCAPETRVPRAADSGTLICFSGTVVRATVPRLLRQATTYTCDVCSHEVVVKASHDQHYQAIKPQRCSNPDIACFSRHFSAPVAPHPHTCTTCDYQEIKLQELLGGGATAVGGAGVGGGGSIPQSVWVTLHHDLVDSCKPGDDVLVCGSVVMRWKPMVRDVRPIIDVVIKANNITVRNKQEGGGVVTPEQKEEFEQHWQQHEHTPLVARDAILASVCPQMYGLFVVKLAVAVVVAGGVQRIDKAGTRVRGEAHLLLVGDPGTGKSQLLQWASSVRCRAVLTTGVGSSAAGLTVAAVREPGGDWGLEAGALVLADGGLCCIDEFSSVREADRAAIHEAMEQQTISVAKAGMVCKLNSRCSIVAATNPKGRYDPNEPLNLNVGVSSPLLSRFDLILVLRDTNNANWDKLVSSYILSGGSQGNIPTGNIGSSSSSLWSHDKMRAYFRYIRRLQPTLSQEANLVLTRFYQLQRSLSNRDKSRTTIRLLESLVRLSQGHARLMLRSTVTFQDAVVVVLLLEAAMTTAQPLPVAPAPNLFFQQPAASTSPAQDSTLSASTLHAGFPLDPQQHYRRQVNELLQRLQLPNILTSELARLDEEEKLNSALQLDRICYEGNRSTSANTVSQSLQEPNVTKVPQLSVQPSLPKTHNEIGSNCNDIMHLKQIGTTGAEPSTSNAGFASYGTSGQRPHPGASLQRGTSFGGASGIGCTQDIRRRDIVEELEENDFMPTGLTQGGVRSVHKKKQKRKRISGKLSNAVRSKGNVENIEQFLKHTDRQKKAKKRLVIASDSEDDVNYSHSRAYTREVLDKNSSNDSDSSTDMSTEKKSLTSDTDEDIASSSQEMPDDTSVSNSESIIIRTKNLTKNKVTDKSCDYKGSGKKRSDSSLFVDYTEPKRICNERLAKDDESTLQIKLSASKTERNVANDSTKKMDSQPVESIDDPNNLISCPDETYHTEETIGLTQKARTLLKKFACPSTKSVNRNQSSASILPAVPNEQVLRSKPEAITEPDNSNEEADNVIKPSTAEQLVSQPLKFSDKTEMCSKNSDSPHFRLLNKIEKSDKKSMASKLEMFAHKSTTDPLISEEKENTDANQVNALSAVDVSLITTLPIEQNSSQNFLIREDSLKNSNIGNNFTKGSTMKRFSFQLNRNPSKGDDSNTKPREFLWTKSSSTEKSYGKFASSQELDDEDFEF